MKLDISLLFDKNAFIEQIELIFSTEQKDSLSIQDLYRLGKVDDKKQYYSDLVARELRDQTRENDLTREVAISAVEKSDWDKYAIGKLYDYHAHNKDLKLSEDQIEWIKNWCLINIDDIDFTKSITVKSKDSLSINYISIYLWFFMRRYNFDYPKDKMLDMLSYDGITDVNYSGIKYLEEKLPELDVKARILRNLEKGIEAYPILKNHLGYCKRYKVKEGVKYAVTTIKDSKWHDDVRKLALNTIIDIEDSFLLIEDLLPNVLDDFKWSIVRLLIDGKRPFVHKYLSALLENGNDEDRYKASKRLIELDDITGLSYYTNWVSENLRYETNHFDQSPLNKLKTIDSIPLLFNLYKISFEEGFNDDDFYPLTTSVINALSNIALISDENFEYVKTKLILFIKENLTKYPEVRYLNLELERLEQRYYVNKSENVDINIAIEKLALIYKI